MKGIAISAMLLVACVTSPADSFQPEGQPFHPSTNTQVLCTAPTNGLPVGLWVYRVMPEAISAAVVSNAMALGHFTMKDFSKSTHPVIRDKNLIYFFAKNEAGLTRHLFISPGIGAIEYQSERDNSSPAEDAPSAEETEKLARKVLFELGIDSSLICNPKPGYDETSIRFKWDKEKHRAVPPGVTNTVLRGIAFQRRIDGVLTSSGWVFMIHFRSHGEIEDYSLTWRNLLPQQSYPLISVDDIVHMIKDGQAVLPEQFDNVTGVAEAKALTITKITPLYFNGSGKEAMDFLKPYAELEMRADFGTNSSTFFLTCPILSTNVGL